MIRSFIIVSLTLSLMGCFSVNHRYAHDGILRAHEQSSVGMFSADDQLETFDQKMPNCKARIGERSADWDELCAKLTERELEREQRIKDQEADYYSGYDSYGRGRLIMPRMYLMR